jgi:uncharacterized membrane protein (DUF4010 family)
MRRIGWEFVHVCIDDASRIAFSRVMRDERKASAVAFLEAAVAYYASLGVTVERVMTDRDTLKRQRAAVSAFAKAAGYHIIAEYSDDGARGADPVDQRAGFAAMLKHIASNGVRTVLVETASRFARDIIVQEILRIRSFIGAQLSSSDIFPASRHMIESKAIRSGLIASISFHSHASPSGVFRGGISPSFRTSRL